MRFGQATLPPRRPYSRVFLAHSRRHLRIRFGCKVHFAARSSILGHRVSGNAIRNGKVPALVHVVTYRRWGQGRDFHNARPRLLCKSQISISLLRSHYKIGQRRDGTGASTQRSEWPGRLRSPQNQTAILAQLRQILGSQGKAPVADVRFVMANHPAAPFSNSAGGR